MSVLIHLIIIMLKPISGSQFNCNLLDWRSLRHKRLGLRQHAIIFCWDGKVWEKQC